MITKQILRFSLLIAGLFPIALHAQKVDTVEIDGKQVFVYPFRMDVSLSNLYWEGIDTKKMIENDNSYDNYLSEQKDRNVPDSAIMSRQEFKNLVKAFTSKSYWRFRKYYTPKMGPMPTRKEFKRYARMRNRRSGFMEEQAFFSKKKFKKAVREHPEEFLVQNVSLDQDITPMLDPIPDGEYVQYYENFLLLQKDGSCIMANDYVAGRFTMKNNTLDGEATWVDLEGDTIKHGWFDMGLKVGEWAYLRRTTPYLDEADARIFVETGTILRDTTFTLTEYKQGIQQGNYQKFTGQNLKVEEGMFNDGVRAGEWRVWWKFNKPDYTLDTNQLPLRYHFVLNSNDSLIVHPTLIRNGAYNIWYSYDETVDVFNFISDYDLPILPRLYEPAFPKEEDLDLDEEGYYDSYYDSYYGDMPYYEGMYYDEGNDGGYDEYVDNARIRADYEGNPTYYDLQADENKLRSLIFDSLGAYPIYDSIVEAYYPNGQLAYRYELENGLLKYEPTVYWDNGKIHDEITFEADSNHYLREIYDYDGVLFLSLLYDSVGNVVKQGPESNSYDTIVIDGYEILYHNYSSLYDYYVEDSVLAAGIDQRTLVQKSWRMEDTSVVSERYFDPSTFEETRTYYTILGGVQYESTDTYSENYESWTGTSVTNFGDFQLNSLRSAGIGDWTESDSIPILNIKQRGKFEVESDHTLMYLGEPFTGDMRIDFRGKKFSIGKSKVVLPQENKANDHLFNVISAYRFQGKIKDRMILETLPNTTSMFQGYLSLYREIFLPLLSNDFNLNYYRNYNTNWEGKPIKKSEQRPVPQYIDGTFVNGKPEGKWYIYDQFGKVMTEANYFKGEREGKLLEFAYQEPFDEYDYYDFDSDTLPKKRTYYLQSERNYKNGMLEGKKYTYDWLGRVIAEETYKEGYMDGISIERNSLAVSYSEFKDGMRDGYSRTYLTLEGKDSLLLFDLNFQNGLLQGESRSYHTNGNISKRGFFLQGQPIEDYEGYDSLGFRYHYVKFEYSFPVEEKIWEENELSVRYKFNWEDSIEFFPLDITESESLEALLVKSGLSGGWEYRPYYGRQSIVDKEGVDYHLTKYYPNDTVARDGAMVKGEKSGLWEFFSYYGEKLYEVDYFDSVLVLNDSVKFNAKGIYTDYDAEGNELFRAFIIEKSERFDCSHKDHYEVRQFYTISETHDSLNRMNGEVFNFYDNGTLQSYGTMKDGLPNGIWRYYDPAGKLNKYGNYVQGKRNGRWLSGDLSKTKYLGDICLNPNMPDIEEELRYRENFLDIQVINYVMGKARNYEFYDINMNRFIELEDEPEEGEEEIEDERFEDE